MLNPEVIIQLMREADDKWFPHQEKFDYNGHLAFTAKYIVSNYQRRERRLKKTVPTRENGTKSGGRKCVSSGSLGI